MRQRYRLILLFLCALAFLLFLNCFIYAKTKYLQYLPRDRELHSQARDYTDYTVSELSCEPAQDLAEKIARCLRCVELKDSCPDCCLNLTSTKRALKCSEEDDPKYGCTKAPFAEKCQAVKDCQDKPSIPIPDPDKYYSEFKQYCSGTTIPECQNKGCPGPSIEPDYHSPDKCQSGSGDSWICNTKLLTKLKYSGCKPEKGTITDCNSLTAYNVTLLPDDDCPKEFKPCWKYTLETDYRTCMDNCNSYADNWEKCVKGNYCCKEDSDVCQDNTKTHPGFDENCIEAACTERRDWPECQPLTYDAGMCCDGLNSTTCLAWQNELNKCLDPKGTTKGKCASCFEELGYIGGKSTFYYDFVARSKEKIMVIWQLYARPEFAPQTDPTNETACGPWGKGSAPSVYFYTMVKIFDISQGTPGTEVYPLASAAGTINQRNFSGAFSIFAATIADESFFKQGKKYRVKLYYFLPQLNTHCLRTKISRAHFIVLRIRE